MIDPVTGCWGAHSAS
jgi:hypothetical protein